MKGISMLKELNGLNQDEEVRIRRFTDYLKVGYINTKVVTAEARANSKYGPDEKDFEIPDEKSDRFIELMKREFRQSLREQSSIQSWGLSKWHIGHFGNEMANYYCELTATEYIDRDKMMDILYKIMNHYKYTI